VSAVGSVDVSDVKEIVIVALIINQDDPKRVFLRITQIRNAYKAANADRKVVFLQHADVVVHETTRQTGLFQGTRPAR